MEISRVPFKRFQLFVSRSLFWSATFLLTACASTANQTIAEVEPTQPVEVEVVEPEVEQLPLSSELVYYVLMAEIAGQRGEIGAAADLYGRAAETIESTALAGRSAQIANFTRNQTRINRALDRWLEVAPNDADIYIMKAPLLMLEQDFSQVVTVVDKALSLAPEKSELYLSQVADSLSEIAKPEQALDIISQLKAYQADEVEALFIYGRLAAFFKLYQPALDHLNKVLQQQAEREQALVLKAEVLQRLGQGNQAIALLKPLATKQDASINVRFSYAKLLGENNKIDQARQVFEQLVAEQPENDEALFALGLLALEAKEGALAKQYFSQLVSMGDPGKQASYFMGLAEELNNEIDAALVWYASVPAESQRFQAAQTKYVNLLADQGKLDKARLHLKLLRKESPEREVAYYVFEAVFLRDRGELQAAFDLYGEALIKHPDNLELLYGRAMTAEPLNRLSVLEDDIKKILVLEPNNATALNALGYTLADRTDRHQEALSYIEKALAISPEDPFYLDSLGWVYYRMGRLDDAVRYLQKAVEIQEDPEFSAHLGEVLWVQNKQDEAKRVWQRALQQAPNNVLLKETMSRFGQE